MTMRCQSCGAELAPGDSSCGECGTRVGPAARHPSFEAAERKFFALKGKHASGLLTDEEYDAALKDLIIQDEEGRPWMLGAETGQWYYHDGEDWVAGEPPGPEAALPARRGHLWVLVAGITAIAIMLCLGSIPILWLAVPEALPLPTLPQVAALATEAPSPTITAARATSTTPTAIPPPSRTSTATPLPSGSLLFGDDFSDPSSGWTMFSGENTEKGYADGEYYVVVNKQDAVSWGSPGGSFSNLRLEVDARKVAGPDDNSFGVVVRRRDDDNLYLFQISSDGYYKVLKQVNGEWQSLVDWKTSPHINQGDSSNHISLVADGPNFSFYVNYRHLADVTDSSFGEGGIGLLAGAFDEAGVRIHFDNLEVWGPKSKAGIGPSPSSTRSAVSPPLPTPTTAHTATPTPVPPSATAVTTATSPVAAAAVGCPGPRGTALFFDDFGNADSGWMTYRGDEYEHFYEDGEFHFSVWATDCIGYAWMQLAGLAPHYRIETQAWKVGGPDMNNYGLLFGGENERNYLTFRISDSGSYKVAKLVEGQWTDLVPWTQTPFVHRGAVNFLGLRVDGTEITVCLNGQALSSVSDPTLESGWLGIAVGAYDEPVHIHFDNLGMWNLD